METTIRGGKIQCRQHGSITAIDCDTLQNKDCSGCFIHTALRDISTDTSEFSIADVENLKEVNTTIN